MAKLEKKALKKTILTVEEQEQALKKLKDVPLTEGVGEEVQKTRYPKETQRVNLDLPQDLYDAITDHAKKNGQTLKGFFVVAAWEYLENRKK